MSPLRLSRISSIAVSMSAFSFSGSSFTLSIHVFLVFLCFSHLQCSSECLVWESIIFHPIHVTAPCKSFFWILSITVLFPPTRSIFLIVSFLTFCSLETPSIFLSQPISVDRILLSSRFLRFRHSDTQRNTGITSDSYTFILVLVDML